ncbi:putative raffinose synthase protein [Phaeomoniella chlamydospora]|uniref:Putative raffinose synthase protein n=1 Tax=Phaeomoniella chlamydospora TaxID=158046 RepID=A0A0G2EQU0_PHACM|nr:putative raffinose synthase protein [Phaeomoniella chlamydospora]
MNGDPQMYATTFHGQLKLETCHPEARFTVRFRPSSDAQWQWANQTLGTSDGEIIFQSPSVSPGIADIFEMFTALVEVESLRSQSPGASVFLIKTKKAIPNVNFGDARMEHVTMGRVRNLRRYFALIKKSTPWIGPTHGLDNFRLTEAALLCSFLNADGKNVVLLALDDNAAMLTMLESDDAGNVVITARNDSSEPAQARVLVSVADEFDIANAAALYAAREYVLRRTAIPRVDFPTENIRSRSIDDDTILVSNDFEAQWLEDWYDGLAYCTWNSLGQELTEGKIINALDSLSAKGIEISSLIIDDNWQSLDNSGSSQFKRGWVEFEADRKAFPNGLRHTAVTIRSRYPNVQHIAVWHALCGYWGWISPSGKIANEYVTKRILKDKSQDPFPTNDEYLAIDPDDIHRMYDDFYRFLASSGIDSVKTDVQCYLDVLGSTPDRRRFTDAYQDAWLIAINKHFSAKAISCMSHVPQIIFHSLLPKNRPTILFRNSDDFFPDVADSHPYHLFWNAHNALLVQHLNVLPDWDMFQTSHEYASFHAAARCLSGGPIYITDYPGQHDIDLIKQITARNPRGQTVILRPSTIGKTLDIYNDYSERHILRIGSYNGRFKSGVGFVGLFNIDYKETSCLVPIKDFPGVVSGQKYIIRSYVEGRISSPVELTNGTLPNNLFFILLPIKGYEILTAHPLYDISGSDIMVAPLGLLRKMTGGAALVSAAVGLTEEGNRVRIRVALKALGTLGVWVSDLESRSIMDDFLILMLGRVIPVEAVSKMGHVLEIDVERAWDETNLSPGWSNEASVEIIMKL